MKKIAFVVMSSYDYEETKHLTNQEFIDWFNGFEEEPNDVGGYEHIGSRYDVYTQDDVEGMQMALDCLECQNIRIVEYTHWDEFTFQYAPNVIYSI